MKKLAFPVLAAIVVTLLQGCAASVPKDRPEKVTLILYNHEKIQVRILDIRSGRILFQPEDSRTAFEYGSEIFEGMVKAIKLRDGTRMSVREFADYRKSKRRERQAAASGVTPDPSGDPLYQRLKTKKIEDLSDKEFEYFMLMKKYEVEKALMKEEQKRHEALAKKMKAAEIRTGKAAATPAPQVATRTKTDTVYVIKTVPRVVQSAPPVALEVKQSGGARRDVAEKMAAEFAEMFVESGTAGSILALLDRRQASGVRLTESMAALQRAIQRLPRWQQTTEDMNYLTDLVTRGLTRAFAYNPEGLRDRLGLQFDASRQMDTAQLIRQFRVKYGASIPQAEMGMIEEVLGESSARALQGILTHFDVWEYMNAEKAKVAVRQF